MILQKCGGEEGYDYASHLWSGSGTETDPWLIQTPQDLACLSWRIYNDNVTDERHKTWEENKYQKWNYFYPGFYFKQTANIDISDYWWASIGKRIDDTTSYSYTYYLYYKFSGNYDGNGYTVSGMFTSVEKGRNNGLFEYVSGLYSSSIEASIKNLGLINGNIEGMSGIVSDAFYVTIENCYNENDVTNDNGYYSGGIIGRAFRSKILRCYNVGSIKKGGGIVGRVEPYTDIINCYNTGSCSSGIIKGIYGDSFNFLNITISNCYNKGVLSGAVDLGGIVGYLECLITNAILEQRDFLKTLVFTNCFNFGNVIETEKNQHCGGIVGLTGSNVQVSSFMGFDYGGYFIGVTNSYYGGDCTLDKGVGYDETDNSIKLDNLADLVKDKSWYSSDSQTNGAATWNSEYPWDFDNVWGIHQDYNDGFPTFKNLLPPPTNWIEVADNSWEGDGTEASPYIIDTPEKLAGINLGEADISLKFHVGKYFKQTANIDLAGYKWTAIGMVGRYFGGHFDGGNFEIRNMFEQGLFGAVYDSTLKNIKIKDSTVTNMGICVGALAGGMQNSTVTNCHVDAFVVGSSMTPGGFAGTVSGGTISDCSFTGQVQNSSGSIASAVGGFAGQISSNAVISNCYVDVQMDVDAYSINSSTKSSVNVGGIAGIVESAAQIKNCIANVNIQMKKETTGGIGVIAGQLSGSASNVACYGEIINRVANAKQVAGLVGHMKYSIYDCALTNCSYSGGFDPTTTLSIFTIETSGKTKTINSCYISAGNKKLYTSGDFADWGLVDGMNNGLPMQRELFFMAEVAPTFDVSWFANNGFSKLN